MSLFRFSVLILGQRLFCSRRFPSFLALIMPKKHKKDDVLSLFSSSDDEEFSGFEPESNKWYSIPKGPANSKKLASVVTKVNKTGSGKTTSTSGGNPNDVGNDNVINLDNLTSDSVEKLRSLLGLTMPTPYDPNQVVEFSDGDSIQSPTPLHRGNMSSHIGENLLNVNNDLPSNIDNADCLQADEDSWNLPKLKIPDKGDPISESLATLIQPALSSVSWTISLISTRFQLIVN